jgi:hypothetical protein
MYTRQDLVADVIKEANAIKANATKQEIDRLDFNEFDPFSLRNCIYGKMTGNCFCIRAADLIELCTPRFFKSGVASRRHRTFDDIKEYVNGEKVKDFFKNRTETCGAHFSAIEAYIILEDANNKNLIDFIKGQTEILQL